MTQPLQIGDKVYLGSWLARLNAFGTISDLDTPDLVEYTIEGYGPNAVLSVSALQGEQGQPGDNAPLGSLQFPILDSTDDLPANLTDDPVDIGKYWIIRVYDTEDPPNEIGSNWAMWDGSDFEIFKEGTPGEVGPVPKVTPVFNLVTEDDTDSWSGGDQANGYRITKTGSDYSPTWTFDINREIVRGPAGTGTDWNKYTIGDEEVDNVPTWDGTHYVSSPVTHVTPQFFTYPEGHFSSIGLAFGTSVPIGTCLLPSIDHDTVPHVMGHFRLSGIEGDLTPFIIGVEVRLGDPISGQIVGRGWGNSTGYVSVFPHASSNSFPNDAITPDNGRAVIPANSTGAPATLYVNAFNDGAFGAYHFEAQGAQLSVLAIPV